MLKPILQIARLVLATTATAGAAQAQLLSSTTFGTVTWSGAHCTGCHDSSLVGSDASMLYGVSQAYGPHPFSDRPYHIGLFSNYQDLTFQQSGGVTVSAPPPPYPNPVSVKISGSDGAWGWSYDTAATSTSTEALTVGRLGNLPTLNYLAGDSVPGLTHSIKFYVYVYLPGDWTTEGTATGDYLFNGVAKGFSTPTFTYDSAIGVTTVFTEDLNYTSRVGRADLDFTLIGSAVPEPSTWAMMLLGFAGLGYAGFLQRLSVRPGRY